MSVKAVPLRSTSAPPPAPLLTVRWSVLAPIVAGVAGCLGILARYGTPWAVSGLFLAYLVVLVALPGTIAWRLLARGRGLFLEQVVVGSALALSTQAILGFLLAPLHASRLSWVWAPAVLALSLLPRLRRTAWSTPRRSERSSVAGAWVQAGAVLAAVAWVGVTSLATHPLVTVDRSGPWVRAVPASAYVDLPFHQSLAAGIDRFYPLVYPYLDDEPLHYHLLAYEHIAGVSAATGIDLTWVLYRLDVVALVSLAVLAVGVLARRASGVAHAAPVAAVMAALSSAVAPYGWTATPFTSAGLLQSATFRSPTQTFGLPLLVAAVTVAAMILPRPALGSGGMDTERRPKRWLLAIAFGILAVGAGGAKSTTLPVLIGGVALTALVAILRRRDQRWPAVLLAVSAGAFVGLIVVFLHGQAGSLGIRPFDVVVVFWATGAVGQGVGTASRAVLAALGTLAWLSAGAAGVLLARRARRHDPVVLLLVGTALAGPAAALLTTASGASEVYFLYASWPVLVVLAVWGWADTWSLAVGRGLRRPMLVVSIAAAALGPTLVLLARVVSGRSVPPHLPADLPVRALVTPWLAIAAGLVAAGAITYLASKRGRRGALLAVALVAVALSSATVVTRPGELVDGFRMIAAGTVPAAEGAPIPLDGARAALFVRDHAAVNDVIATNAHCVGTSSPCDARHFWVSALTERRVLVEGWAYPEGFRPGLTRTSPFWDTARYTANQVVFTDPTSQNVAALRDEYGVTWLFVDRTVARESDRLRDYAQLVLDDGDAAVYRIGG